MCCTKDVDGLCGPLFKLFHVVTADADLKSTPSACVSVFLHDEIVTQALYSLRHCGLEAGQGSKTTFVTSVPA